MKNSLFIEYGLDFGMHMCNTGIGKERKYWHESFFQI